MTRPSEARPRTRGFLVALVAATCLIACRASEKPAAETAFPAAPVIIISVDTLRSDRLPAYGYDGVRTPSIDALRADAVLFERAYAPCPLTLPSHVSLLTGRLPADTGVRNNIGYLFDPAKDPTIPALLKEKGYATGAAVSAWVLRGETGLGRAFDFYDDELVLESRTVAGRLQRPGAETIAAAERWISGNSSSPFFFMLHLFEPHSPYEAPEPFRSEYADPYDAEVAASDALVGRFLDFLRANDLYDRSTIIFLSDHGEGLMDHGEQEHGIFLYREAIQVPLIMKLPGRRSAGTSVATPVQLLDVMPTIAEIAGLSRDPAWSGVSLLEIADGRTRPVRRIFAETLYPRIHIGWSDLRSLIDEKHHFIEAPAPELYDIVSDPGEKTNVIASERRAYAAAREAMSRHEKKLSEPAQVTTEQSSKLRALGYLGSTSLMLDGADLPDPKESLGDLLKMQAASERALRGEKREAIHDLEEVIDRNPRFHDAIITLAQLYEETGDYPAAIRNYRRAIDVNPANAAGPASAVAWIYLRIREFDQAEAHAKLALPTYPAYASLLLGRIALARGDLQTAAAQAREAMKDASYYAAGSVLLAQAMTRSGRPAEALPMLDAVKADLAARGVKAVPLLEFARGDAFARLNRMEEAESAFAAEIRLYPSDRETYAYLAVVLFLQGKRDEAAGTMEDLVRAIADRDSYELAAQTFEKLGDARKAAEWTRRAAAVR